MFERVRKQRNYFLSGATLSYNFRKQQLTKFKNAIKTYEEQIMNALKEDLGKNYFESYATEISMVYNEINYTLRRLKKWMKPKRVPTTILSFGAKSKVHYQPVGVVLIMSPWNYPFQLTISPLVAAIAAGNCVVLKPSRYSNSTSQILTELIQQTFPPEYITIFQGGRYVNSALLEVKFDHIFFTGSTHVGKIVAQAAASHLTPITLELGGKSPCIVDSTVDINKTAKRIIWGKALNAGQTCVAPDYVLVNNPVKQQLIEAMEAAIFQFFGSNMIQSPDYGKIINERAFKRLVSLLDGQRILLGGDYLKEQLKIGLTLIDSPSLDAKVMQEEIFGPILPIISYNNFSEALEIIQSKEKPLALYLFTKDKKLENWVIKNLAYGGGCINDSVMHVANHHLPFGGIGASGIGAYHGKKGFETFSHAKSILKQNFTLDLPLRYPPYRNKLSLLKRIIK